MKKILLSAIAFSTCLNVSAQKDNHLRYKLPNGKIISGNKLDSVEKAWGNRGILMNHNDKHPDLISISRMTAAYLKQMDAEKADLNKLLNKRAPDFSLTGLNGKRWTLSSLKGRTVVLNFWFTTCPGCIQEMPNLNKLKKNFSSTPIVFLALAPDNAQAIKIFLKSHSFDYNLLPEAKSVINDYHVSTYPTSMVIDPQGFIRFQQIGGDNIEQEISFVIKRINRN